MLADFVGPSAVKRVCRGQSQTQRKSICVKSRSVLFAAAITTALVGIPELAIAVNLTSASSIAENFNSIGSTATASLPADWKMSAAGASAPTYSATGNWTSTTDAASSGNPTAGGRYNWGNGTTTTDRAIGFMTSGGYSSPNSIMVSITNANATTLTGASLAFDIERYRVNSTAASVTFFTSTDGSTWTAQTAGDSGGFATGSSAYDFSAGTVVSKSFNLTGLSVASGSSIYLRWNFSTGSSNSQGLGLDNFSMTGTFASPLAGQYWDADAAAGFGGTGTWNSTRSSWNTLSDGNGSLTTYDAEQLAHFAGTAGTVTIATGGVAANAGLSFETTGYSVSGAKLTLGGTNAAANTIAVTTGTATINADIDAKTASATTGLTKTGAGTLLLGGAVVGDVAVSDGTVQVSGLVTGNGTVASGKALQIGVGGATGSWIGDIANSGTLTFNRTGTLNFDGVISGAGSVTKDGTGTLVLTGINTYSGLTTIAKGTLNIASGTLSGSGGIAFTGGLLQYAAGNTDDLSARIANSNSVIAIDSGSNIITFASALPVSNTGGLTKSGAGTLILSGANAYTGTTTVSAGVLSARNNAALGATGTGNTTVVSNGAALEVQGSITSTEAIGLTGVGISSLGVDGGALRSVSGTNSVGAITLGAASRINVDAGTLTTSSSLATGGSALTVGGAGTFNLGTNVTGSGSIVKDGSGTLILGGSNTTLTAISSSAGTIRANNTAAFNGTMTLTSTALVQANGFSQSFTSLNGDSGTVFENASANAATVTLTSASGTTTFSGTLRDGTGGGALSLSKTGNGVLVLSGNNQYSGNTSITAGTVQISSATALGSATGSTSVSGAGLEFSGGFTTAESFNVAGTGNSNGGVLRNVSGSNGTTGTVTLTNTTTIASDAGTLTLGNVGGAFALTLNSTGDIAIGGNLTTSSVIKNGNGILTLSGSANTVPAVTVNAGKLQAGSSTGFGAGTLTLTATAIAQTNGQSLSVKGLTGASTNVIENGAAVASTLTADIASGTSTFAGTMRNGAAGSLGLTKSGAGTLTLSGTHSYTGATSATGGILNVTGSLNGTSGTTLSGGATLASGLNTSINGTVSAGASSVISTNGGAVGTLALGGLTLANGTTLNIDLAASNVSDKIDLGGGVLNLASGTQTINLSNSIVGTFTLLTYGSKIGGDFTLGGATSSAFTYTLTTGANATILQVLENNFSYFDRNGNAAGSGVVDGGTYSSIGSFNDTADGTGSSGSFTAGKLATFSAGTDGIGKAYTVTIDSAISAAGIAFEEGDVTLAPGAGGSLTLTTASISVAATSSANIAQAVAGAAGLAKSGGLLILSGNNSYTGLTTVSSGVLNIRNDNALGASGSGNDTRIVSGAALELQGGISTPETITLNGTGISSGGALRNVSGNNAVTGAIALGTASRINSDSGTLTLSGISGTGLALTVGGAGDVVISGSISTGSSGTLIKDGTGTLTLQGANTYTGSTTIGTGGAVTLANNTGLGTTAGSTTVADGAALQIQGGITSAEALSITGSGQSNGGAIRNRSGSNTLSGTITLSGSSRINSDAGTLTLNAVSGASSALTIGGSGDVIANGLVSATSLTKDGNGKLTLSKSNAIPGSVNVNGGTVAIGHPNAINSTSPVALTGGAIETSGNDVTIDSLSGSGGTIRNASGTTASTLTINPTSATASSFSGNLADGGAAKLSLVKTGSGEQILAGNNTHTGGTTISAGTLRAASTGALGSGTTTIKGGSLLANVNVANDLTVNAPQNLALAAGWDFQTTTNGGTAAAAAPNSPNVYISGFGSGTLYLNGTNGASTWSQSTDLSAFGGSSANTAGTSFSTATSSPASLALLSPSSAASNNNKYIVFKVSKGSANSIAASYDTQSTSAGFDHTWSYSTDGSAWTALGATLSPGTSFSTQTLPIISGLADFATIYLRMQVTGASGTSQNTRLDNVQVNAVTPGSAVIGSDVVNGLVTYSGALKLDSPATLTAATGGKTTFSGLISNNTAVAQGIIKSGPGKVVLSNNNTFSGGATISAGTLLAENIPVANLGSATGSGLVSINSGGTLAGTGKTSAVNVNVGGVISAGSGAALPATTGGLSADSIGTLSTGDQTWKADATGGGTFVAKFDSFSAGTSGHDVLAIDGALNLSISGGGKFNIILIKSTNFSPGTIDLSGTTLLTLATAASLINGSTPITTRTDLSSLFALDTSNLGIPDAVYKVYGDSDGGGGLMLNVQVDVSAAPEPTTAALFGLGGTLLLTRRRRKRSVLRELEMV